jgi:glycosyltransferase involved in cell wall biosynthesis
MIPYFTIIIPVKTINDYVRETVPHIQSFLTDDWELVILPNEADEDEWNDNRIKIIASGKVGPAKKRDLGAEIAQGDILVFLDDDSYPDSNLLEIARPFFNNTDVVALGGPAITPPHDDYWQKVSGAVFLSRLSGGSPERYISVGQVKEVQDWPSVNMMVRKADFLVIGGFNSPYWPGEDTKLCLDLIKKTGKKILYIPNMVVWHHRRAGLAAHLKQIGGYGLHRGYFAKKYPETSRKITFFIPSIFLIFFIISLTFYWMPTLFQLLITVGWGAYILALLFAFRDIAKYEPIHIAFVAIGYAFLTHLFYGLKFIQGLFTSNLVSRLR